MVMNQGRSGWGGGRGAQPPSTKSVGNSQHYATQAEIFGKATIHQKNCL